MSIKIIKWRSKNIEILMVRDKLNNAAEFREWLKIAKSYDKLQGKKKF